MRDIVFTELMPGAGIVTVDLPLKQPVHGDGLYTAELDTVKEELTVTVSNKRQVRSATVRLREVLSVPPGARWRLCVACGSGTVEVKLLSATEAKAAALSRGIDPGILNITSDDPQHTATTGPQPMQRQRSSRSQRWWLNPDQNLRLQQHPLPMPDDILRIIGSYCPAEAIY